MAQRTETVQFLARSQGIRDFVIHVLMGWPGTIDKAMERADDYFDNGATVVTLLRRVPSTDISEEDLHRFASVVRGRTGILLEMEVSPDKSYLNYRGVAFAGVARTSFSNQWPYLIRGMFHQVMELQFSE